MTRRYWVFLTTADTLVFAPAPDEASARASWRRNLCDEKRHWSSESECIGATTEDPQESAFLKQWVEGSHEQ